MAKAISKVNYEQNARNIFVHSLRTTKKKKKGKPVEALLNPRYTKSPKLLGETHDCIQNVQFSVNAWQGLLLYVVICPVMTDKNERRELTRCKSNEKQ